MLLSVVVALVLTPVLCATLLKPVSKGMSPRHPASPSSGRSSGGSTGSSTGYGRIPEIVALILVRKMRYMVVYLLIVVALVFLFLRMPTSYLPDEDQGFMYSRWCCRRLDPRADRAVLNQLRDHFLVNEKEAVASVFTVAGSGFSGADRTSGWHSSCSGTGICVGARTRK